MNVTAVVVAGRRGDVDLLAPVLGVPLLVRSVCGVLASGVVGRVLLVGVDDRREAVLDACAGLPVDIHTHAAQRSNATAGDDLVTLGLDGVVIVHDVARPLAPPELLLSVLAAAGEGHDVVVPVLPLADTVKQVDAEGIVVDTPDRTGLRVVQTPQAYRGGFPLDLPTGALASSRPVHTVPGDPLAFAVHSAWDLELAELLIEETA
jgi:2-C-methyl-D-erythritol 4-phosphate cytidylyltransferase